jgi:hypothetical protein
MHLYGYLLNFAAYSAIISIRIRHVKSGIRPDIKKGQIIRPDILCIPSFDSVSELDRDSKQGSARLRLHLIKSLLFFLH